MKTLKQFAPTSPATPITTLESKWEHVREILHGNYRIVYRQTDDVVEILTVYHSARLLDLSQIDDD